jgi:hypothetical protein
MYVYVCVCMCMCYLSAPPTGLKHKHTCKFSRIFEIKYVHTLAGSAEYPAPFALDVREFIIACVCVLVCTCVSVYVC